MTAPDGKKAGRQAGICSPYWVAIPYPANVDSIATVRLPKVRFEPCGWSSRSMRFGAAREIDFDRVVPSQFFDWTRFRRPRGGLPLSAAARSAAMRSSKTEAGS